jgi:hypothetical protein
LNRVRRGDEVKMWEKKRERKDRTTGRNCALSGSLQSGYVCRMERELGCSRAADQFKIASALLTITETGCSRV